MALKAKSIIFIFFISFLTKYILLRLKKILYFFIPRCRSANSENLIYPRICPDTFYTHHLLFIYINLQVRQLGLKEMKNYISSEGQNSVLHDSTE